MIGRRIASSPSIHPDDPESSHYDPQDIAGGHHAGEAIHPGTDEPKPPHSPDDGNAYMADGGD